MDLRHINIFDVIGSHYKKVAGTNGGEYAGACPQCGGDDRFRVWDNPADGSNPAFWCRQCDIKGDAIDYLVKIQGLSFIEAAQKLGLEPDGKSSGARKGYANGQDYANRHGLDWQDLLDCGWEETEYQGRPALTFKTKGGQRWRFLDGEKPKYISEKGFERSWYHLNDKVIQTATDNNSPLFLCNGEISMIAARWWGVPAIAIAGGSEKTIPDNLLTELIQRWDGQIAIALDCDETGRREAQKIAEQLGNKAVVIDLGLSDGQDLADYVKLHGSWSIKNLKRLIPLPMNAPMSTRDAARLTTERLDIHNVMEGKPLVMPYTIYHQYGGYAKICYPGKLTGAVAMSGHGKTSWLNTGIDALIKRGDNGVGVMPEFEGDEYQWDRLQRYSGQNGMPLITATKMMEWELWKCEHRDGVPPQYRMGYELTGEEKQAVTHINDMVEGWKGEFTLYSLNTSLEDTFIEMGDHIQAKRASGQIVSFGAFDYIQILQTKGYADDDNVHEYVIGLIKKFCMRYKIHGFISSQVNKTADKSARSQNKILGSADMRYVRDDKINCLITLNPIYDEISGEIVTIPGTNYQAGIANIAKNNKGKKGYVNQMADFEHLTWLDHTYSRSAIALDDEETMYREEEPQA